MAPGWIAVALGRDVPSGVTRAVIVAGHEVVLWRGAEGVLHAWEDRCPHRGMRLSFGFVRGDTLNCLYHGWQYGAGGQCARIPAHPDLTVPPTITAKPHGVHERGGLVWIRLLTGGADEPPALPEGAAPVASMVLLTGTGDIAAAVGEGPLVRLQLGAMSLHLAWHSPDAGRVMVHAVVSGAGDPVAARAAGWEWLLDFRRRIEGDLAA